MNTHREREREEREKKEIERMLTIYLLLIFFYDALIWLCYGVNENISTRFGKTVLFKKTCL